jgi:uncharacterized membrane protein YdbT with pleckstrin-like domain
MKSLLSVFHGSDNSFQDQEAGENVVLVLRQHPFVLWARLSGAIILAILPTILVFILLPIAAENDLSAVLTLLLSVWYLVVWQLAFYVLTMYMLNVWIITDRRIIASNQNGFFDRTVSELRAARIQDVTAKTDGIFQTFLHFGDVQIQTAGSKEEFEFKQVPHPEVVKDAIMQIAGRHADQATG